MLEVDGVQVASMETQDDSTHHTMNVTLRGPRPDPDTEGRVLREYNMRFRKRDKKKLLADLANLAHAVRLSNSVIMTESAPVGPESRTFVREKLRGLRKNFLHRWHVELPKIR